MVCSLWKWGCGMGWCVGLVGDVGGGGCRVGDGRWDGGWGICDDGIWFGWSGL